MHQFKAWHISIPFAVPLRISDRFLKSGNERAFSDLEMIWVYILNKWYEELGSYPAQCCSGKFRYNLFSIFMHIFYCRETYRAQGACPAQ